MKSYKIFSSNVLKTIALLAMTIDHIGLILFPSNMIFRYIGRLAFPIFAYLISEGAKHTKNYLKYFLLMFFLGILYLIVYYVMANMIYLSIFITFSFSLALIFLYRIFLKSRQIFKKILISISFVLVFILMTILDYNYQFDYGFIGALIPFFCFAFTNKIFKMISLIVLLVINSVLSMSIFPIYINLCSLFAIPLLLLYNGKRGKYNLKYLFYIYYPLHLIIIYIINFFI